MSNEVAVCAWRNCDAQFELIPGAETKKYCCKTHKTKAYQEGRPEKSASLSLVVWKSSGFCIAKALEGAEKIAEARDATPDAVKSLMLKSLRKRINLYFDELEGLDGGELEEPPVES